jgi:hypothetical protein
MKPIELNCPAQVNLTINVRCKCDDEGTPAIGEYWEGRGGIYGGLRQYPEGLCHIVFAAEDVAGRHAWGDQNNYAEGTDSRTDGRANTAALLARDAEHPAAIAASGHIADGHADFYLPAMGEIHHIWQFAPGSFDTGLLHWSSSQLNANYVHTIDMQRGMSRDQSKHFEFSVRPVRRFLQ